MTKIEATHQKCSGCGGNLLFSPSTQSLKCPNCESLYQIEAEKCCPKHDFGNQTQKQNAWENENKVVKCQNCGASVVLNRLEYATNCPYCSSSLVVETSLIPGLKPDAIIPFQFDKVEASKKFAHAVKKKLFVPNKFKKQVPESKIQGIYIPTFLFDANSKSRYNGVLLRNETTRVNDRLVTTTKSFSISGNKQMTHKNITIEASAHISQTELDAIKPFDYSEFYEFNEDFLRGYFVEMNDDNVDDCHSTAREVMREAIRQNILSGYSYDGVQYLNVSTDFSDEKFSYGILPTYRFNYSYKNKNYTTFMNGQTGQVGGGIPRSGVKITFFVIAMILIVLGIFILVQYLK